MYGLAAMYGIIAQPADDAAYSARQQVHHYIPDEIEYKIVDTTVLGDPTIDDDLSVEVEVIFPSVDSEDELPSREDIFPTAEGVSFFAVDEIED